MFIRINTNTPFIIYGAGDRGYLYKEKLIRQKFNNIVAFLDRKAECILPKDSVPVWNLLDDIKNIEVKEQYIIIIAISNVFKQRSIVEMLFKYGFRYFLFEPVLINQSIEYEISRLYDMLTNVCSNESLLGKELPMYRIVEDKRNSLITNNVNDSHVVSWVPAELLFGLTEEFFDYVGEEKDFKLREIVADKPLFYFNISGEMMRALGQGIDENYWIDYLRIYNASRNYVMGTRKEEKVYNYEQIDFLNHMNDRLDIYQNMNYLLNVSPKFFQDHPLDIKWNDKGYFNVEDGNNRATFLISKDIFLLPCRMSRQDYNKWLNVKELENFQKYIKMSSRMIFHSPISHPNFIHEINKEEIFSRRKLYLVFNWFGKNCIKIKNIKVLDLTMDIGFYGQFSNRMGAKTTIAVENQSKEQLIIKLNKLLNISDVNIAHLHSCFNNNYEIVFAPCFSIVNEYSIKIVKQIEKINCKFMVVDIKWNSGIAENIIENTQFSDYIVLQTVFVRDNIYQICVFIRM